MQVQMLRKTSVTMRVAYAPLVDQASNA